MHELAVEPIVVDVQEWTDPDPARRPSAPFPFADSESVTVQILLDDGYWHRPMAGTGGERVACGQLVPRRNGFSRRHETYSDRMCLDGCFSDYELEEAAKANKLVRDALRKEPR